MARAVLAVKASATNGGSSFIAPEIIHQNLRGRGQAGGAATK
jgi:hypothetical protein